MDRSDGKSGIKLDSFQLDLAKLVIDQLNTYGQSALEVMTSGGKSYIAAYIMHNYISQHRDADILWLAPKSAVINVKDKIFSKTALRNRIHYIGYEELSRGNINTDFLENNIQLVVIDECHKAYAKKTFQNLEELLSRLGNVDRLVMSATPKRYDGKDTFSILTPKVTDPIRFDIKDAAEHDLLPILHYVLANMSISSSDFREIERYKKIADTNEEAKGLYEDVIKTLSNFKFDLRTDLGELLKTYIHSNGEAGERHIAFFSSIQQIGEMHGAIEEAFQAAYPKCKVNILEYHSGLTDAQNYEAFKQFVLEEPEPNRIDVMLSVDKATESIHPDNVRTVLMFRGTQSVRVYLQQMGRGLMLKSYHPEDIVIFDFADNVNCVGSGTAVDKGSSSTSISAIRKDIMQQFGYSKGLQTDIGLTRIKECVQKLKEINRLANIRWLSANLKRAKSIFNRLVAEQVSEPTNNIYYMISEIQQEGEIELTLKLSQMWKSDKASFDKHWEKVKNNFEQYQKMFLGNEEKCNKHVLELFKSLGYSAYLIQGNGGVSEQFLKDIDYIKAEIDKCGDIQSSTNTHAKHRLKKLRLQYAKGLITPNICKYAERNGINIDAYNITSADIQLLCETDNDKEISDAFRPVIKQLSSLDKSIANGGDLSFDDWLSCKVKMQLTHRRYRDSEMAYIYYSYIRDKYGYIINAYKLSQEENENGTMLISALFKIINNQFPNKTEEDYIFAHHKLDNMSAYELRILKEFNIGKNKYISDIEDKTDFISTYNKAISGDPLAIKTMLTYNKPNIHDRRTELLEAAEFTRIQRETKDTVGVEVLIKKAKMMCVEDQDYTQLKSEISKALKDGSIKQLDIATTPFRTYELNDAIELLTCTDEDLKAYWEDDKVNILSAMIERSKEASSCVKETIHNIIDIDALDSNYKDRLSKILEMMKRK